MSKKKNYKWSFRKFSRNMGLLMLVIIVAVFCSSLAVKAFQVKRSPMITVQTGDTLWKLALDIAPDQDPRHTIAKIKYLNNLNSSDLTIGQNLRLELTD